MKKTVVETLDSGQLALSTQFIKSAADYVARLWQSQLILFLMADRILNRFYVTLDWTVLYRAPRAIRQEKIL